MLQSISAFRASADLDRTQAPALAEPGLLAHLNMELAPPDSPARAPFCCVGTDMPGVGHVYECDCAPRGQLCAARDVLEVLRRFLDGESLHLEITDAERDGIRKAELAASTRDRLLCQLMFAAKDLAESQIEPRDGSDPAFCTHCVIDEHEGVIAHDADCRVGRVVAILQGLVKTVPRFYPNQKEDAREGGEVRPAEGVRPAAPASKDRFMGAPVRGIPLTEAAAVLRQAATDELAQISDQTVQCNACGSSVTGVGKSAADIAHAANCWVGNALVVLSSDDLDSEQAEPREWVIQRCTQKWIGTDLQYEDFATLEGRMTKSQMVEVLGRVQAENPNDEFRGHRLVSKGGA